jgi:hypothetical protein
MVYWQNAYVQKGFAGIRDIFGADSFMGYFQKKENLNLLEGGRYRPLSLATFAAEVGIFGKDHPGISHFINILLYGLTGILLYRIVLNFFPAKEGGRWYFSRGLHRCPGVCGASASFRGRGEYQGPR